MELQCTRLKSVVIQNSHSKSEKQKPPKRVNRHQSKNDYTASKRRDSSTPSREQTHTWHRSFVPRSSDNQCYPRKKSYQTLSKSKNSRGTRQHSEEERRNNYPGNSHDYESSSKSTEPSQNSPQKRQVSTKKPSFYESRSRERENFPSSYNSPSWEGNHSMEDYPTYQQNFCEYDKNLWPNEYSVPNMEFFLPLNYDQSQSPSISSQTTHEPTSCYFPNQALSLPEEQHYAIRETSDEVFNGGFYNYDFHYSFLNFRDNKNWINPPIENKIIPCTSYSNFPVNTFFNSSGFLQDNTSGMNFPSDSVHYMFPQVPQFCDSYIPVRQHIIPSIPKSKKKTTKDNSNEFDEALKRIMMEQFSLFTNFTPQFSTWCLECCGWDYGKAADSFIYNSHIVKRIPYMAYNA